MTYSDEGGLLEDLVSCTQDGVVIGDQKQHDAWHKYLEERLQDRDQELAQTREELSEADALSQGVSERAAAAVRYAEACRTYFRELVVTPEQRRAIMSEMKAADELWNRIR